MTRKEEVRAEFVQDGDPSQDRSGGFVIQFLTPLYNLITAFSKGKLNFSPTFWSVLTIALILTLILFNYYVAGYLLTIAIITLLFEFLSLNPQLFKKQIPKNAERIIDETIASCEKQSALYIASFLEKFQLNYVQLKTILTSRHGKSLQTYRMIAKTQVFSSDFIDYILEKKLDENISDDVISLLIEESEACLNKSTFNLLWKRGCARLRGVLALKNPDLVEEKNWFQRFVHPHLKIDSWLNYFLAEPSKKFVLSIAALVGVVALTKDYIFDSILALPELSIIVSGTAGYLICAWIIGYIVLTVYLQIRRVMVIYWWGSVYSKKTG